MAKPTTLMAGALAAFGLAAGTMAATPATAALASSTADAAPVLTNMSDYSEDSRYDTFYNQELQWSAENCADEADDVDADSPTQCAFVKAPKNWHDPSMGTIDVAIMRNIEQGDWENPGDRRLLFSNPGGPGGDGMWLGAYIANALDATETHNSVGIDPRGVGKSTNLICPEPGEPTPGGTWADGDSSSFDWYSTKIATADINRDLSACVEDQAGWVEYVNTEQTARDFNLVRAVLGYDTADYYGISYGTWLGSVMERMFPNTWDRVILDGNLDWTTTLEKSWDLQSEGFQLAYDRIFMPFLARHDDEYGLGASTREVDATLGRIRAAIVNGELGDEMTGDAFDYSIAYGLYWNGGVDEQGRLASALNTYLETGEGDLEEITAPYLESNPWDAGSSVFMTLRCADTQTTDDAKVAWDINIRNAHNLPLLSSSFLNPSCQAWPHKPAISNEFIERPVGEVMMVQNEGDPATGYYGGVKARENAMGDVKFLAVDDLMGHGLPSRYSECAFDAVNGYIVGGQFPTSDIYCQVGPLTSGDVSDKYVYELQYNGAKPDVYPRKFAYLFRNLGDPRIDWSAPVRDDVDGEATAAAATAASEAGLTDSQVSARLANLPFGMGNGYLHVRSN